MKRFAALWVAVSAAACSSDFNWIELGADHLIAAYDNAVLSCPLDQRSYVGAEVYRANPACEDLFDPGEVVRGFAAGDDIVVYRRANDIELVRDRPVCRSNDCVELWSIDLHTRAREKIAGPGPIHFPHASGDWITWIDVRHDENGDCFWPEGDPDCAVDLYGFDRRTRTEHRLTPPGSIVAPPFGPLSDQAYDVDGTHAVYVDAAELDVSCFFFGAIWKRNATCRTSLRAIDLETKQIRLVTRPPLGAARPFVGGGAAAWLELTGTSTATLKYAPLTGTATAAVTVYETTVNDDFDVDGEWVVHASGGIEAIHAASGTRQQLSAPDESGYEVLAKHGRIVWRDPENEIVSLFDLRAGRRTVFLEGR